MTIEEFLSWDLGERPIVNIETGKLALVVSGFTQGAGGHLEKYRALKTDKAKQAYLEEKRPGLWTRGFAPEGTNAYEFEGAGDIMWNVCENWVEITDANMEMLKEKHREIWWEVKYAYLEYRTTKMEIKFAQMGVAFG